MISRNGGVQVSKTKMIHEMKNGRQHKEERKNKRTTGQVSYELKTLTSVCACLFRHPVSQPPPPTALMLKIITFIFDCSSQKQKTIPADHSVGKSRTVFGKHASHPSRGCKCSLSEHFNTAPDDHGRMRTESSWG